MASKHLEAFLARQAVPKIPFSQDEIRQQERFIHGEFQTFKAQVIYAAAVIEKSDIELTPGLIAKALRQQFLETRFDDKLVIRTTRRFFDRVPRSPLSSIIRIGSFAAKIECQAENPDSLVFQIEVGRFKDQVVLSPEAHR